MKSILFFLKTYLPAFLFSILLIEGCKKSNDSPGSPSGGYYISFKANGVQKQYSSQPFAVITYDANEKVYTGLIGAYKNFDATVSDSVQEQLSLLLFSNSAIAANSTFQDPAKVTASDGSKLPPVQVTYYNDQKLGFLTLGLFADSTGMVANFPNAIANGKVTITELTATYAKGTFSGTAFLDTDLTTTEEITDGEFYVKRD
jgi:hypothetical protein